MLKHKSILLILFIILMLSFNVIATSNIKGDVDGINGVNSIDYLLVKKHILGISKLTGEKLARANVDGKGDVTAIDCLEIKKIILFGASSNEDNIDNTNNDNKNTNSNDNTENVENDKESTTNTIENNRNTNSTTTNNTQNNKSTDKTTTNNNSSNNATTTTPKKLTITFDSSGGSKIDSQKIDANGKVKAPSNPKRSGYIFIEWQLNNKKYDFNQKVTSDIKLVAIWAKLNKTSYPTKTNSQIPIESSITPSAKGITLTYTTNDKDVATVNSNGIVYGVGAGNTTITVKANNVIIGNAEIIVDYSYFDTCSTAKSNTKVSVKTDKNRTIKIYSCLENQRWFHQGIAVTKDSIIYAGAAYQNWCNVGSKYEISKYNIKGNCDSKDYGVVMYTSGNFIRKYDKKTGKYIVNYLDVGGHGQAFDATSNNELYINYFPKIVYSDKGRYGSHTTGVAYIKNFVNNGLDINPNSIIRVLNNGNIGLYNSKYQIGTVNYFKDIIAKAKEKGTMETLELAVDEEYDKIGILKKEVTTNGNMTFFVYKLSDFVKGKKNLINTYYFNEKLCSGRSCGHQGIEMYGDYLYSVHESGNYEGISKIKYTTCLKTDKKGAKCTVENLDIPENKIGTEYGKKIVGLDEIEGISVSNGKVYVSVMTNGFSDKTRRNITLLLEGF